MALMDMEEEWLNYEDDDNDDGDSVGLEKENELLEDDDSSDHNMRDHKTNEENDRKLRDDENYHDTQEDEEHKMNETTEEDVLHLGLDEDDLGDQSLVVEEAPKRNDKFTSERAESVKNTSLTTFPPAQDRMQNKPKTMQNNKRQVPKNSTNFNRKQPNWKNNFQKKPFNKNVRGVNYNQQAKERRSNTVLINPKYSGNVQLHENSARLAYKSNNEFIQPWASSYNVQPNLLQTSLLQSNPPSLFTSNLFNSAPSDLVSTLAQSLSQNQGYSHWEPPPTTPHYPMMQVPQLPRNEDIYTQQSGSVTSSQRYPAMNSQQSTYYQNTPPPFTSQSSYNYNYLTNSYHNEPPKNFIPQSNYNGGNRFESQDSLNYGRNNDRSNYGGEHFENRYGDVTSYVAERSGNSNGFHKERNQLFDNFRHNEPRKDNFTKKPSHNFNNNYNDKNFRNNFNEKTQNKNYPATKQSDQSYLNKNVQFEKNKRTLPATQSENTGGERPQKILKSEECSEKKKEEISDAGPLKKVPVKADPVKIEVEEEDEETRQYILKIQEQKRERERILKLKEERRKMALMQEQEQNMQHQQPQPAEQPKPQETVQRKNNFSKPTLQQNRPLDTVENNEPVDEGFAHFTFKINNNLVSTPVIETVKAEPPKVSGFLSNRVVSVKSVSSKSVPKASEINKSSGPDPVQGYPSSTFFSSRKIIIKDSSLINSRLVAVSNLSASTSQNKLVAMTRGIGEVQKINMDKQERQATILFKTVASAHAFYKRYHRFMLDLSMIQVTLEPMVMV